MPDLHSWRREEINMQSRREFLRLVGHAGLAGACSPLLPGCTTADRLLSDSSADFAGLAKRFNGTVLIPTSNGYDAARRTFSFNPRTDRHPAAIARCKDEFDVVTSVEFARASELEIAVRSGGGHRRRLFRRAPDRRPYRAASRAHWCPLALLSSTTH